ncbi:MAG: sialidase family protein, partial [Bacteroidota bacterium]
MNNFSTLLFSLLFILSGSLAAQSALQNSPKKIRMAKAPANQINYTGFEPAQAGAVEHYTPSSGTEKEIDQEIQIGRTIYDLQSNSASCNRISGTPAGRVAGVWTQGLDEAGGAYPDRGTGYNTRIDGTWGDLPEARLETVRTGWPNHVFTASGKEFVVAHTGTNLLSVLTRDNATAAWAESTIPSTAAGGLLWPRAAVGGADGESIHVIAITTPIANGGMAFEGVDGHILYHRSTDSGATWDKVDIQIDGLGSDFTVGTDADSYQIHARGNVVAFAVFNGFDDVLLFKSEDNGETWTKSIVNDFPLELYQVDDGYAYEDIPPFDEEVSPDSLAMFTSDGFGSVVVDYTGKAHVFFGEMWVLDDDLTDGNSSYFPGTDGIAYWNEDYPGLALEPTTILGVVDQNGNDTLDIESTEAISLYFASLSSMPSAGVDQQGNLNVTYASVVEG